jgi:hypothetical protein
MPTPRGKNTESVVSFYFPLRKKVEKLNMFQYVHKILALVRVIADIKFVIIHKTAA